MTPMTVDQFVTGREVTPRDVIALAQEHGVRMVDFKFTDMPGTWQHLGLSVNALDEDLFEEGLGFGDELGVSEPRVGSVVELDEQPDEPVPERDDDVFRDLDAGEDGESGRTRRGFQRRDRSRVRIVTELEGSQTGYTWVVLATLLTMTATTPIWGKLADLVSKKLLVQSALVIFSIGLYCRPMIALTTGNTGGRL